MKSTLLSIFLTSPFEGLIQHAEKVKESFFVTNCDILLDVDYQDILKWHTSHGNMMTLVGCHKEIEIPYGILEMNDGKLKKFIDIPIVVKLVYRYPADMVRLAKQVEAAGADALVIGHSLDGIDIDPETGRLVAAIGQLGRSSFSGRGSFPYWLNLLFQVCQNVHIPVIGGHGVLFEGALSL